jgi:hypothetical protein
MYEYRLHYLADNDSANWKKYTSESPVRVGDAIQLACGFYHCVTDIKEQKTGVRLDLSKAGQGAEEAMLLARQLGHFPKN